MRDFTVKIYTELLDQLIKKGYSFQTMAEYFKNPAEKVVILRHDIDAKKKNALVFAKIQNNKNVTGTYYFRVVPQSWDEKIIRKIADLNHEVGYHYEDMDIVRKQLKINNFERDWEKLTEEAWKHFQKHLKKLREISPVSTVCMHGSPLSPINNKVLLEKYDYKSLGIICEPYFDINFSQIYYLTDTGRRWDGEKVSVRDKIKKDDQREFQNLHHHSTRDVINIIKSGKMPNRVMFTFHPQRWNDNNVPWFKELIVQNLKNIVKYFLIRLRK